MFLFRRPKRDGLLAGEHLGRMSIVDECEWKSVSRGIERALMLLSMILIEGIREFREREEESRDGVPLRNVLSFLSAIVGVGV